MSFLIILLCIISMLSGLLHLRQMKHIARLYFYNLEAEKRIHKFTVLLDIVNSGLCNKMSQRVFYALNDLSVEDFPKDSKELSVFLKQQSNKSYEQVLRTMTEKIAVCENPDEKAFLKAKLEKFNEVKLLSDLIDENSSAEYINSINLELNRAIYELNQGPEEDDGN